MKISFVRRNALKPILSEVRGDTLSCKTNMKVINGISANHWKINLSQVNSIKSQHIDPNCYIYDALPRVAEFNHLVKKLII